MNSNVMNGANGNIINKLNNNIINNNNGEQNVSYNNFIAG